MSLPASAMAAAITVFPVEFRPSPNENWLLPQDLFFDRSHRWVRDQNGKQALIFTDGALLEDGFGVYAGCAFVYGAGPYDRVGFRLEDCGPSGEAYRHTLNRAKLRAAIAALCFRYWHGPGEDFNSIVIASDSDYVVTGATERARMWSRNGWRTGADNLLENRDLWETLLNKVEELHRFGGFSVFF